MFTVTGSVKISPYRPAAALKAVNAVPKAQTPD
jgi:hypothetical protein